MIEKGLQTIISVKYYHQNESIFQKKYYFSLAAFILTKKALIHERYAIKDINPKSCPFIKLFIYLFIYLFFPYKHGPNKNDKIDLFH